MTVYSYTYNTDNIRQGTLNHMKNQITTVTFRVSLSKHEKSRIRKLIVKTKNLNAACVYAGINDRTFNRALNESHAIKSDQRDKLISFCDLVEGTNVAA